MSLTNLEGFLNGFIYIYIKCMVELNKFCAIEKSIPKIIWLHKSIQISFTINKNVLLIHGSLYYQSKKMHYYKGNPWKSPKFPIHLHCLIPPIWVPFNDPCDCCQTFRLGYFAKKNEFQAVFIGFLTNGYGVKER